MINTAPVTTADFASPERSVTAYQAITSDLTPGRRQHILPDNLIDLVYTVKATYRARGTWVMNSLTPAVIRKLKDITNQDLWQPGLAGQPDGLPGYPVEIW